MLDFPGPWILGVSSVLSTIWKLQRNLYVSIVPELDDPISHRPSLIRLALQSRRVFQLVPPQQLWHALDIQICSPDKSTTFAQSNQPSGDQPLSLTVQHCQGRQSSPDLLCRFDYNSHQLSMRTACADVSSEPDKQPSLVALNRCLLLARHITHITRESARASQSHHLRRHLYDISGGSLFVPLD